MTAHPLRVAILTHSTNARGGVVHALELAQALGIGRIDPVNLEFVVVGNVQAPRTGVVGQARRLACEVQETV